MAPSGGPASHKRRTNLAEDAAVHLRAAIMRGDLRPGQRIDQDAVAETLGISRLPVREALIGLAQEGLVDNLPRRGAFVARFSKEDVVDHYQLFGQVAGLAAARAVARMTPDQVMELKDINQRLITTTDVSEQQKLNHEFHRRITIASASQRIISMVGLLSRSLPMPYEKLPREWLADADQQHSDIIDAFLRRDTLAAQRSMEQHIASSGRHAVEVLDKLGFFARDDESHP
ncbi:MAG: GntR family transcriptional regulator [Candidatus Nanopelagicales bacterium]|jgi:DNA-binding GntR family transcriptional regulator